MENLAKALAAFQAELPKVGKGKTANIKTDKGYTYSYTYADLGTLTHLVLPVLVKHGLSFITAPRSTENGYELAGILLHESGEQVEGALPLYGRTPQEIGSAITYARRYLLGSMTGVVTEDDDDAQAANKAERLPAKDWGPIADTAEMMNTVEDVKALWTQEGVAKAPKAIQDRIKAHVDSLKANESA